MPILLDLAVSRRQFAKALELARSDQALTSEWLERARKVHSARSGTFMAMLGTALLAKATNAQVDPFSLKVRDFPTAYNARGLCKDVLVPSCVEAGVRLPTTGAEPLNNQPFFRHERVDEDMKVHPRTRPDLAYLCDCLRAAEALDGPQSIEALAAFLRVGLEGPAPVALDLAERSLEVPELIKVTDEFVAQDPEAGKRGQALVAACLSLVFEDVQTRRVHDPGRRWPGDVAVGKGKTMTLAAEVKQRPAAETEILQFVARCEKRGVRRAVVATLAPTQAPLAEGLRLEAWRRHAVHLTIMRSTGEILEAALNWTPKPLQEALSTFPRHMLDQLRRLEVSEDGLRAWAAIFQPKK